MADRTKIQWTDATWNPIRGCSRVSDGCTNCYAERVAARFSGPGLPYNGLACMNGAGEPRWTGEVRVVPEHLADPLRWRRPRRVFVNSMSDMFHERLTNEQIAAVFGVMAATPQHTHQVLTKRADRMREWFAWVASQPTGLAPVGECLRAVSAALNDDEWRLRNRRTEYVSAEWPMPNVWLGVSCEDQATADERIPLLLQCPAAVRFVSAEPLLGPVDLAPFMWPVCESWPAGYPDAAAARADGAKTGKRRQRLVSAGRPFLRWVVCGGESGPGARPCSVGWIRSIVAQCRDAGVAAFVKQGGASNRCAHDAKGGHPECFPGDLQVREFPA